MTQVSREGSGLEHLTGTEREEVVVNRTHRHSPRGFLPFDMERIQRLF